MDLHYSQTLHWCLNLPPPVSLPYGFTLFSNELFAKGIRENGFTTLWIYTILKLTLDLIEQGLSFTTLWIYTILKQCTDGALEAKVSLPYGFTLFSNQAAGVSEKRMFHYLMDLHYSQTTICALAMEAMFHYLMDLHYSQTIGH